MEPLYEVDFKWTKENYYEFSRRANPGVINALILIVAGCVIVADIILIFMSGISQVHFYGLIFLGLVGILELEVYIMPVFAWRSYGYIHDAELKYLFYEDYFEVKSETATSKIKYDDVNKLSQTKRLFNIFISSKLGYGIEKASCPSGLIEFVCAKTGKKIK